MWEEAGMWWWLWAPSGVSPGSGIRRLRAEGHQIGLFRPITLFPFPEEALRALAPGRRFLVMEQNTGQMVEDVRLALFAQPGISASSVLWHGIMPGLFIGADALVNPCCRPSRRNSHVSTAYRKSCGRAGQLSLEVRRAVIFMQMTC